VLATIWAAWVAYDLSSPQEQNITQQAKKSYIITLQYSKQLRKFTKYKYLEIDKISPFHVMFTMHLDN
jgi:hypothetical protein